VAELGENAALATDVTATRNGPVGELATYLERALARIRHRAEDRAIELRTTVSIARAEAEVDLGLVSMIVAQLADNAVEFGHPGGWAHVSLDQTADFLRLVVEDNGPGLSDELRNYLLGECAADLSGRFGGGFGLGLSIVAHAARTLRAQVSLDSRNDKGARIRLIIPLARAA
jgi:signal transduction histidine kinase